jgi:hypothetical protein
MTQNFQIKPDEMKQIIAALSNQDRLVEALDECAAVIRVVCKGGETITRDGNIFTTAKKAYDKAVAALAQGEE